MSKDNQQKKVFDVMRPGKALASPTSRPVITGHKPAVKDDQFVGGEPHMASNPFDDKSLMSHSKEEKFAGVEAHSEAKAEAASGQPEPAASAAPQPEPNVNPSAEEQGSEPEKIADLPPDLPKEDIALVPSEPDAPAPESTKDEQSDTASQVGLPELTPEDITDEPKPSVIQPSAPSTSAGPSPQSMSHDDVMAATEAPVLDRAIVSHHKVKSKWWEWLLVFFFILLLALVALNFLIDAEIIDLNAAVPHTNLID